VLKHGSSKKEILVLISNAQALRAKTPAFSETSLTVEHSGFPKD
jgi:hypothetical protein